MVSEMPDDQQPAPTQVELLLQQLLEGQQSINERLDKIEAQQDDIEPAVKAARERLRRDAESRPQPPTTPESEMKVAFSAGGTTIEAVPPTQRQKELRAEAVDKLGVLQDLKGIEPHDARDAFIKGGLPWLHVFDRDHVMSLLYQTRAYMIQEMALTMPIAAEELCRDVLKRTDSETVKMDVAENSYENTDLRIAGIEEPTDY